MSFFLSAPTLLYLNSRTPARRRWHRTLRILALPTRRTTGPLLRARLAWLPHKIRLRVLPTDPHGLLQRGYYGELTTQI